MNLLRLTLLLQAAGGTLSWISSPVLISSAKICGPYRPSTSCYTTSDEIGSSTPGGVCFRGHTGQEEVQITPDQGRSTLRPRPSVAPFLGSVALSLAVMAVLPSSLGVLPFTRSGRVHQAWGGGGVAPASALALDALEPQFYGDQLRMATPVRSVRGLWRVREARRGGKVCKGRLIFRGFEGELKGAVEYMGCDGRQGKGRWILKPGAITGGRINLSARWKINFPDGTAMLYRGDVTMDDTQDTPLSVSLGSRRAAGGTALGTGLEQARLAGGGVVGGDGRGVEERPNAHIHGELLEPVTGRSGTLTERLVGDFEADLLEPPDDTQKL